MLKGDERVKPHAKTQRKKSQKSLVTIHGPKKSEPLINTNQREFHEISLLAKQYIPSRE